jgi:hypothetical protein
MSGTGLSETERSAFGSVATPGWLLSGVLALAVLPGCGAIVESAVENAVEEAAGVEVEEGEDGSFSIEADDISIQLDTDEDGGTLSIDGPDGSVEVDASEDGTVNVTSEDFEGEEDQELTITADAEVPDGFPLPFPDGGVVESGSTWDTGDRRLMTVSMRYEQAKLDELISFYDDYFEGQETLTNWDTESSGQRTVGYSVNPDGQATAALISTDSNGVVLFLETTVLVG